jgi:hypothetical protein
LSGFEGSIPQRSFSEIDKLTETDKPNGAMEMHGKTQEASVQIENVSRRISAAVLRGELEGDWRAVKRVVDDIQSLGEMGRPGEDVVLQPLVLLLWATVMAADSMNGAQTPPLDTCIGARLY